jgi:raffinose/stachyose/melibiose transport system substrate-binding protein
MKKTAFFVIAGFMALAMAAHGGGRSAAPSGGGIREAELNIMMSIPQHMDQWESYCRQFQDKVLAEKNIRLRINLEMPSSEQYDSILQTRLTGGDAPDLYALHCNNIGVYAAAGNLADLSVQPLAAKIYENIKETVSINGKLMAVPIESQAWGGLYNKDIFEKCGLTPPETLADLKQAVQILEGNGYTPFLLAFQEQWVPQLMTALALGGKVSGEIPDWVERMNRDAGSYREVREIFEVIRLIMDHGTSRAMEEGSEVGAADFANGKAAMFIQGTWASNTIMTTNPNMRLGVFPLPVNNNVKCTLINLSTSTTVGVYPGSKELDLALEFANYILDDKDSSALFQACGFNPIAACHDYEAASWVEDASRYVAAGRAYQDLVLPASVTNEQGKLLQEWYVGSITVEDIIQRLDKAYQDANRLTR